MRVFSRPDAPLVAFLLAALVVIFAAEPISRLLDYVRDIERQSGLTLLPGLVVLSVFFIFLQLRKRQESQADAAKAEAAKGEAERRAQEFERLVTFGHGLARAHDRDALRAAIGQHLPAIAGTDRVWVLVREGAQWHGLTGDARGAEEVIKNEDFASRLLDGANHEKGGHGTIGFPLVVGGTALGVLGVTPAGGSLNADRHRAVEAAAALLAVSIKNEQLFREVRENSWRDALTGCMTRTHATEMIDAELRRARRSQVPVSIIMFDLDHFKSVNDRYGHLCGDAVLAAVGRRMREVLRGSDLKCRWGGEEFLVVLPETPTPGGRQVAETLRREIAETPVTWGGETLKVTASFGLTQAAIGEINIQAIVGRADIALYRAKEAGRNAVRFEPEPEIPNQPVAVALSR